MCPEFSLGSLGYALTENAIAVPRSIQEVLPQSGNIVQGTTNAEWLRQPEIDPSRPTLIYILGASGSGKDASYRHLLGIATVDGKLIVPEEVDGQPLAYRIQTITNRARRVEKGEGKYEYWFIDTPDDFDQFERENQIIEHSKHNGGIYYATSRRNIITALTAGRGVAVIRNEIDGARNLMDKLAECEERGELVNPNHVIVFITTDTYEELWGRIQERRNSLDRIKKSV